MVSECPLLAPWPDYLAGPRRAHPQQPWRAGSRPAPAVPRHPCHGGHTAAHRSQPTGSTESCPCWARAPEKPAWWGRGSEMTASQQLLSCLPSAAVALRQRRSVGYVLHSVSSSIAPRGRKMNCGERGRGRELSLPSGLVPLVDPVNESPQSWGKTIYLFQVVGIFHHTGMCIRLILLFLMPNLPAELP